MDQHCDMGGATFSQAHQHFDMGVAAECRIQANFVAEASRRLSKNDQHCDTGVATFFQAVQHCDIGVAASRPKRGSRTIGASMSVFSGAGWKYRMAAMMPVLATAVNNYVIDVRFQF